MKKTLFLLAAAAACTACSMDETTEVAGNGLPIDFRTAVATRAQELTNSLPEDFSFKVWAFYEDNKPFFPELTLTATNKGSGANTYTTEYYWPTDNSELTFYTYTPDLGADGTESITGSSNTITYTPNSTITGQKDLATCIATGTKANQTEGVELAFKHALSQIEVQAYYDAGETEAKYTYKVAGVQIANVDGTAIFTFDSNEETGGKWNDNTETSERNVPYTVEYDGIDMPTSEGESIMGTGGTWMLIPQNLTESAWAGDNNNTGAYLAVKIQIKEAKGDGIIYPETEAGDEEYGWAAVPIDTNWEAGKKYTYQLKFTDESAGKIPPTEEGGGEEILGYPIKFTVNVSPWESGTTEPVEM